MGKKVDMIGRRFGRLLIISEDKRDRQGIILKPIDKSKSHGEAIRQSLKSAY